MPGIYNKDHLRTDSFPFFHHQPFKITPVLLSLPFEGPFLGGNTHGGNSSMRRPLHPSGIGLLTLLSLLLLD